MTEVSGLMVEAWPLVAPFILMIVAALVVALGMDADEKLARAGIGVMIVGILALLFRGIRVGQLCADTDRFAHVVGLILLGGAQAFAVVVAVLFLIGTGVWVHGLRHRGHMGHR